MGPNALNRFASGASAELYVAHSLVEEGYNILWPLLTQSRYDLVAEKDGKFLKIQVKKATWSKSGNYNYLQARISGKNKLTNTPYKKEDVDFFAFTDNNCIWFAPFEDVEGLTSVCLSSDNPKYSPQTKYQPDLWLFSP